MSWPYVYDRLVESLEVLVHQVTVHSSFITFDSVPLPRHVLYRIHVVVCLLQVFTTIASLSLEPRETWLPSALTLTPLVIYRSVFTERWL